MRCRTLSHTNAMVCVGSSLHRLSRRTNTQSELDSRLIEMVLYFVHRIKQIITKMFMCVCSTVGCTVKQSTHCFDNVVLNFFVFTKHSDWFDGRKTHINNGSLLFDSIQMVNFYSSIHHKTFFHQTNSKSCFFFYFVQLIDIQAIQYIVQQR